MALETLLQVIYYTIMVIVASATVAKLVAKSVASASATVVESNVKVIKEAMNRAEVERNHAHRLDTLERNQTEMNEHMNAQLDDIRMEITNGNTHTHGRLDKLYELIVSRSGAQR